MRERGGDVLNAFEPVLFCMDLQNGDKPEELVCCHRVSEDACQSYGG